MSRLDYATIVIVAICLIAAGFLLYKTYNMFTGDEEAQQDATQQEDEAFPSYEEDEPYYYDTTAFDTTAYGNDFDTPTEDESTTTETYDNTIEEDTPSAYDSDALGAYMVLAGTFSNAANADRFVQDLRARGYPNARVEPFDGGTYDVILVDRFSTYGEASDLVQQLKSEGIEAYVQKKRGATGAVKE